MGHRDSTGPSRHRWLVRPDGRVQVGVGPGAWVIDGVDSAADRNDPARLVMEQLERAALSPPTPTSTAFLVVGVGQVADAVRSLAPRPAVVDSSEVLAPGGSARAPLLREISDLPVGGTASTPVVLVSPYLIPVGTARHPLLAGRAVLPVVPQTGRVVVGPWAGHPDGPCLHCLDLHRCDRDQYWPRLAADLDDPLTAPLPPRHSAQVISAVGALVLLLTSASRQQAPGVSHEIGPEPPHIVTRRWPPHPACPWHAPWAGANSSPSS